MKICRVFAKPGGRRGFLGGLGTNLFGLRGALHQVVPNFQGGTSIVLIEHCVAWMTQVSHLVNPRLKLQQQSV